MNLTIYVKVKNTVPTIFTFIDLNKEELKENDEIFKDYMKYPFTIGELFIAGRMHFLKLNRKAVTEKIRDQFRNSILLDLDKRGGDLPR